MIPRGQVSFFPGFKVQKLYRVRYLVLLMIVNGFDGNVCSGLEDLGIIVRPMGQFGGSGNSFRVNMGTPDENDRFLAGFKRILKGE